MASNAERAELLGLVLGALVECDRAALTRLCSSDVRVWTPELSAGSRQELLDGLDRRDEAFTDVELRVTPLDVSGDHACAEWTVSMLHSGPIELADGTTLEPTGLPIALNGVTVAEFADGEICAIRQYWNERTLFEQLGLTPGDP